MEIETKKKIWLFLQWIGSVTGSLLGGNFIHESGHIMFCLANGHGYVSDYLSFTNCVPPLPEIQLFSLYVIGGWFAMLVGLVILMTLRHKIVYRKPLLFMVLVIVIAHGINGTIEGFANTFYKQNLHWIGLAMYGAAALPSIYFVRRAAEKKIFISHSRADNAIIDEVLAHFKNTGVKAIRMEFEKELQGDRADWEWIKDGIVSSKAVFIILTEHIMGERHEHTQNWISYEVGVAASFNKILYVFRESSVKFAVPYLTNYAPYSVRPNLDAKWIDEESKKTFHDLLFKVMKAIITDPAAKKPHKIKCPSCKILFRYHGTNHEIECPCCYKPMYTVGDKAIIVPD